MDGTIRVRTVASFALAVIAGFMAAIVMLWAIRADAAPGDSDTTFVPKAPCRLADTRPAPDRIGTANSFGPNETKTFAARGKNGQCTLPNDAVALSLNVTSVGASAPTFITVWGDGVRPTASSLNPIPGAAAVPNAVVTPLSSSGSFKVYNLAGRVDVVIDVNGYYTKQSLSGLNAQVVALQAEVAALKTKTASMSTLTDNGQPTVRFTGVNVQVVDGSGDTQGAVNGTGNLIVGYNENDGDTKTGSHNLVVGVRHTYISYGGLVAGFNNAIMNRHASVSGGSSNTASGEAASVSGGRLNAATGIYSAASGGTGNSSIGESSSISGGLGGTASGNTASISGGYRNTASGGLAAVSGGSDNTASGGSSSVSGGENNVASGGAASVSGGALNTANAQSASVTGGYSNASSGAYESVFGGDGLVCSSNATPTQSVACGEGFVIGAD